MLSILLLNDGISRQDRPSTHVDMLQSLQHVSTTRIRILNAMLEVFEIVSEHGDTYREREGCETSRFRSLLLDRKTGKMSRLNEI